MSSLGTLGFLSPSFYLSTSFTPFFRSLASSAVDPTNKALLTVFGPVGSRAEGDKDLIKKATIGYIAGGYTKTPSRDVTYSVVPRATKAYDNDVTTNLAEDIAADTLLIEVNDSSGIAENTYVILNSESIYVDKKDGNKLFVKRGQDQTLPTAHVAGTAINLITSTTNSLIEVGDNFGFDGSLT